MNKFFRTFWAALLAFVVGTAVMWLFVFLLFAGMAAAFTPTAPVVSHDSVLRIDLTSSVVDSPENRSASFNLSTYQATGSVTLLDMLGAIERAETDSNIKGIYINLTGMGSIGITQVEEIRVALEKFKGSGKFIVSYEEAYSQLGYYLSSVSDHIFVHPEGGVSWHGFSGTVMFYKGLLDKLDVEMQILRHGTYKSAVEPFMSDRMSPANREQMTVMVNSLWNNIAGDVSVSRGIPTENLKKYADELSLGNAKDALRLGFVDALLYPDQVANVLAALVNGEEFEEYTEAAEAKMPTMIGMGEYVQSHMAAGRRMSKNKVAVIYAEGDIIDGDSYPGAVGGNTVAARLAEARRDNNVKAVVLRVNSPGGSAMASEIMWREMELLRAEKPVIVSMGEYAASGGYYISCAADFIYADRSTLTGSIGVFGMLPNIQKALKNKVGITTDVVRTSPHADMGRPFRPLDSREEKYFLDQIKETYNTFVNHVADGRNMSYDAVDKIGEGRVWMGTDANGIGLIDGFGGINDAIALAADRAGVSGDFRIYEMTDTSSPYAALMRALTGISAKAKTPSVEDELGKAFKHYNTIMKSISEKGVQARMPYTIEFE